MSRITVDGQAPPWAHRLANDINRAFSNMPIVPVQFDVDNAPSASAFKNHIGVCTNGDAGSRCLTISDGTNWKRIAFGANISKT